MRRPGSRLSNCLHSGHFSVAPADQGLTATPAPRLTRRIAIISANVALIAIGTYGTRDEAEVVQGLLASAGIEASIRADDAGGAFPFTDAT
jgi:hypothetical protein